MLRSHIECWSGMLSRFIIVLVTIFLNLEAVEWKTYEEALLLQKQNKKPIMIDIMRTDCHYCSDMERDVFNDTNMQKWLDKRFIPVKINLDNDTPPLGIKVTFTPSFFFVDVNGEIIKKIPGAWDIKDFKSMTKDLK